eukprot:m.467852 g.467852  ORF g.467852 m.467852 type:complete len:363 (-) comp57066_c0_seq2:190-1278(-)
MRKSLQHSVHKASLANVAESGHPWCEAARDAGARRRRGLGFFGAHRNQNRRWWLQLVLPELDRVRHWTARNRRWGGCLQTRLEWSAREDTSRHLVACQGLDSVRNVDRQGSQGRQRCSRLGSSWYEWQSGCGCLAWCLRRPRFVCCQAVFVRDLSELGSVNKQRKLNLRRAIGSALPFTLGGLDRGPESAKAVTELEVPVEHVRRLLPVHGIVVGGRIAFLGGRNHTRLTQKATGPRARALDALLLQRSERLAQQLEVLAVCVVQHVVVAQIAVDALFRDLHDQGVSLCSEVLEGVRFIVALTTGNVRTLQTRPDRLGRPASHTCPVCGREDGLAGLLVQELVLSHMPTLHLNGLQVQLKGF